MALALLAAGLSASGAAARAGGGALQPIDDPGFATAGQPVAAVNALSPPKDGRPWVAVGSWGARAGASLRPAVWVSSDGRSWRGGPIGPVPPFGRGDRVMRAVAERDGHLVAVGEDSTSGRRRPAVWTTGDGLIWRRVPLNRQLDPGSGSRYLLDATAGKLGFLAVSSELVGREASADVWQSRDGRTWRRTTAGHLPGSSPVLAASVAQGGPVAVAVGETGAGYEGDAAVWLSESGSQWEQVSAAALGGPGEQRINSVTWTGGRFVAVGFEVLTSVPRPVVWTSPDGRAWARAPLPTTTPPDTLVAAFTVVATARGLAASGQQGAGTPVLWESPDGSSWRQADLPPDLGRRLGPNDGINLAANGDQLAFAATHRGGPGLWLRDGGGWSRVLSGPNVVPDPLHPWLWRVRDLAKGKGRFVAIGGNLTTSSLDSTRARGQVWTSSDGRHWQRLDDPGLPFARSVLRHVQFFGGGFVAVGLVRESDDTVHAAAWTSSDGRQWNRGPEGPFSAVPVSDVGTLVAGGPGLVFVATTENPTGAGDLVVWTSADGHSWSAAPADPATLGGAGEQMVFDACTRPGLVLLVGAERVGDLDRAAAWSSTDGVHWSRNPVPPTGLESDVDACVWTGREFLAGGFAGVGDGDAALWSSPDGRAWSLVPSPPSLGGPGRQAIFRLERLGAGLVALGEDYVGGRTELAAWTSADGRGWRRLILGPASVGSAAGDVVASSMIDGGTVYVFGGRGDAAEIWRGRLPEGGG